MELSFCLFLLFLCYSTNSSINVKAEDQGVPKEEGNGDANQMENFCLGASYETVVTSTPKCNTVIVSRADTDNSNGEYKVSDQKVPWAPSRPVYAHSSLDRYIYWNMRGYGWSIGSLEDLLTGAHFHYSGLDSSEPWEALWRNNVTVQCKVLEGSPPLDKSPTPILNNDGQAILTGLGVLKKDRSKSLQIVDGKRVFHPPPLSPSWEVLHPGNCTVPDFPMGVYEAVAMATSDSMLVCGGEDNKTNTLRTCHNLEGGKWSPAPSMLEARYSAAEIVTEYGWLVTGGKDNSRNFLDSMEIYKDGAWKMLSSKLPEPAMGHCLVQVNSTTILVTGGYILHSSGRGYTYSYQSNMFNLETGEWSRKEDMKQDRAWHECFKIGDSIVVAGGLIYGTERFAEVFDLGVERWRKVKDLPEAVDKAGSVYDGDDVIIIAAGKDDNKLLRFMSMDGELQAIQASEKYSTLKDGRSGGVVLKVDSKQLNCDFGTICGRDCTENPYLGGKSVCCVHKTSGLGEAISCQTFLGECEFYASPVRRRH